MVVNFPDICGDGKYEKTALSMKNLVGKLERLRNFSTATLSCLNNKKNIFGRYFNLRIHQNWWLL